MAGKIIKFASLLFDYKALRALGSMRFSGFLSRSGWWTAHALQLPVGPDESPLPWMTYPFIRFMEDRLSKKFALFEFGCGNSTLFFASRVGSVTAVEHDRGWYERFRPIVPQNVNLTYKELVSDGEYSRVALRSSRVYAVIVVDGRDRVHCIKHSLKALKEDGVFVLDDAERKEYAEAVHVLKGKDFRRIDFWGISPGMMDEKCTTIFYRKKNCLRI